MAGFRLCYVYPFFYLQQYIYIIFIISSHQQLGYPYHMIEERQQAKDIKGLFQKLGRAFENRDSNKLYTYIKLIYNGHSSKQQWNSVIINNKFYSNFPLGHIFSKLFQLIKTFHQQKIKKGYQQAFKFHLDILTFVLKSLEQIDTSNRWACKPLRQVIRQTKTIFIRATKQSETSGSISGKKDDLMTPLINKLNQFKTRKTLADQTKKQILYMIDNMEVSIKLIYHKYDQVKRLLNTKKPYDSINISLDIVKVFENNFFFQKGKTALIYQEFKEAEQCFQKIDLRTVGQKRLVLKYLIPCKMFLGKNFIPNPKNQEQHFPEYEPIIKALNTANFNDFNAAIKKYQKLWIKRGIYLLMDKLRIILWRNLVRRVHRIVQDSKIDIVKIHKAVKLSGGEQSLSECICIISNLIYESKLKGYIYQSEEQKVLVMKKDGEAFPSLSK